MENCFCIAVLELGLGKDEFYDLTPYEFSLLVLHHNEQKKTEFTILRNTIYNANLNLKRKKGEKVIPLFEEEKKNGEEDKEKLRKEREALFGSELK